MLAATAHDHMALGIARAARTGIRPQRETQVARTRTPARARTRFVLLPIAFAIIVHPLPQSAAGGAAMQPL
jgi:hypothetical protein